MPTQVTLAAGRAEAAAQREVERASRAQHRAAAKERGRRRAALLEGNQGGRTSCLHHPVHMGPCTRVHAQPFCRHGASKVPGNYHGHVLAIYMLV